jgi:hypothetical protein
MASWHALPFELREQIFRDFIDSVLLGRVQEYHGIWFTLMQSSRLAVAEGPGPTPGNIKLFLRPTSDIRNFLASSNKFLGDATRVVTERLPVCITQFWPDKEGPHKRERAVMCSILLDTAKQELDLAFQDSTRALDSLESAVQELDLNGRS